MAALTDTTIASTYKQLLKLTSEGVGADASAKYVEDGLGTDTALSLSTARVGIGTASPNRILQIQGTTPAVGLWRTSAGATASDGSEIVIDTSDHFIIRNRENASLKFQTNGTSDQMEIASNGRITMKGADGNQLTINDSGSTNSVIQFQQAGTAKAMMGWDNTNSRLKINGTTSAFADNNHLAIHSSGYVQIGGTMGTYALNVRGSNECLALYSTDQYKAAMTLRRNSDAVGSTGTVACYWATRASMTGSGTDVGTGLWNVAGSNLYLGIGASPKLTVNSGGNIGIHEESPDHLLTISHNDDTDITSENIWNGDCSGIHLRKTHDDSGGGSVIKFSADSHTSVAAIAMSQPNSAGDSFLHFYTSDNTTAAHMAERMRIDNSGYLKVPGVYSGNTSSAANVHVTSDGMIYRSTSAKKYKSYIKNYNTGLDMINQMQPISYKSKKSSVLDENDKTYAGLLADDIHDLGLSEFVEYNKDGEVENLFYDRMVVVCINAIKELSAKVAELEKA